MWHKKILLIENNPMIQMVNHYILSQLGHKVEVVNNEYVAVRNGLKSSYDIIFIDVNITSLNDLNRYKVILKKLKKTRVPIIGMSNNMPRDKFIELGMNDFIEKPIGKTVFKKILEQWLK